MFGSTAFSQPPLQVGLPDKLDKKTSQSITCKKDTGQGSGAPQPCVPQAEGQQQSTEHQPFQYGFIHLRWVARAEPDNTWAELGSFTWEDPVWLSWTATGGVLLGE